MVTARHVSAPLNPRRDIDADADHPDGLAAAAVESARRFHDGATLWASAPGHAEHARHVAVEFLHPGVLGARALPAAALADGLQGEPSGIPLCRAGDIVLELSGAAAPSPASHAHGVRIHTGDPLGWFDGRLVRAYHVLWELVQVCLERLPEAGTAEGGDPTSFLYPFLDGPATVARGEAAVEEDLEMSVASKFATSRELIRHSHHDLEGELGRTGRAIAARLGAGGRLFTIGNGGSAADAGAFARLCLSPPSGRPLAARSLASDAVVVSALANDLGAEQMYARQLAAQCGAGDVVVAFSTSGDSGSVLTAIGEAQRRGALTVALLGYDGGAVAAAGNVDHTLVVRSQSVHRIQEAHAALSVSLWKTIAGARA